jgi:hypothetical protein
MKPLTAKELIALLKKVPADMPVYLWQNDGEEAWPITEVSRVIDEGKEPDWIMLR